MISSWTTGQSWSLDFDLRFGGRCQTKYNFNLESHPIVFPTGRKRRLVIRWGGTWRQGSRSVPESHNPEVREGFSRKGGRVSVFVLLWSWVKKVNWVSEAKGMWKKGFQTSSLVHLWPFVYLFMLNQYINDPLLVVYLVRCKRFSC
jgi:hypothetical protein